MLSLLLPCAVRLFRRTKSNTVLLSGLSGSGKTVLFYRVSVYGFLFLSSFQVCFLVKSLIVFLLEIKIRFDLHFITAPRWIFSSGFCDVNGT